MATKGGPSLTTNGLILALDAGDPNCFISGNTTCRNLITGGNISGANGNPSSGTHTPNPSNFPAYNATNGGVFDFAGGRGMNCDENLGAQTTSSICMWFYKNSSGTQYFADGRNNGGDWFLSNYSSNNITWENKLRYNYNPTYNSSPSDFLNQWIFMVVTSNSSGSKLYLNGSEVSTTSSTSADEDFGINYRIGTRYTTSAQWTGYMGPIYFYNTVLTAKEVLQNFNSQKSRFGL